MKTNQISIKADLRDYLAAVSDNYFDLMVVDPPRGNGTAGKIHKKSGEVCKLGIKKGVYPPSEWDNQRFDQSHWSEIFRTSKNQIIWCAPFYTDFLPFGTQWFSWDKLTTGSFGDVELAWTSFKGPHKRIVYKWNGHQQGKSLKTGHRQKGDKRQNEKRIHPCQKPVKIYEWIYQEYAQPGFKICDPTMGSGSSRIAAYNYGLDYVGIEAGSEEFISQENRWQSRKLLLFTENP